MVNQLKVYPDQRPATRAGCLDMPRPCPFVSCRHNLRHEDARRAARTADDGKMERAAEAIAGAKHSCSLDVAEWGGLSQQACADVIGHSRQRVNYVERGRAFGKIERVMRRLGYDYEGVGPANKSPAGFTAGNRKRAIHLLNTEGADAAAVYMAEVSGSSSTTKNLCRLVRRWRREQGSTDVRP